MYLNYYSLQREPFQITPDPEFLYLSPSHREALASIKYGIDRRKGFIAITGEVGVGKTTILRSYLKNSDRRKLRVIYLFNASISFADLLKTIFRELGLETTGNSTFEMMSRLYEVLIEEYRQDHNVVLAVDEAQNMPVETMENLRMLSNLETSTQKLIQILLIGQPELNEKLKRDELRQFRQRIAVRSTINPLTPEESYDYIRHRILRASGNENTMFTKGALKRIVKHAKGIPRVLNTLCSNALITGYGYHEKQISASTVREVISDFEGKKRIIPYRKRWLAYALSFLLVSGVLWISPFKDWALSNVRTLISPSTAAISGTTHSDDATASEAPAAKRGVETAPSPARSAPAAVASLAVRTSEAAKPAAPPAAKEIAAVSQPTSAPPSPAVSPPPVAGSDQIDPTPEPGNVQTLPAGESTQSQKGTVSPQVAKPPLGTSNEEAQSSVTNVESVKPSPKPDPVSIVVKKGDTVTKLMMDVYGSVDNKLIDKVRQGNPQLADINTIFIGQILYFPDAVRKTDAKSN